MCYVFISFLESFKETGIFNPDNVGLPFGKHGSGLFQILLLALMLSHLIS